jgi:hypothetical protein
VSQIGTDNVNDQAEHWELPYDIGATDAQRATIKAAMAANTEVPDNFGDPLYPYGYGFDGFDNKSSVIRTIPSIKNRITIDVLHHTIRIQNVSGKIESVKVYNLNGKLVINRKTVPAPEIRIDIDNKIAQGSYIVEVSGVEKRVLEMRSVFIVK